MKYFICGIFGTISSIAVFITGFIFGMITMDWLNTEKEDLTK